MSLSGAIADVVSTMATLTGVHQSHDYPPNSVPTALEVITWASGGNAVYGAAGLEARCLHNIGVMIVAAGNDIPGAYKTLTGLVEPGIRAIMADPTLNGSADTLESVTYSIGQSEYNGKARIALTFQIQNVKVRTATT